MATRIQRPIMIAVALLALAAVALCWAVVARGSAGPAIAGDFSEDRIDMPDITLTDHHGALRPLRGELTAGRLVVVNFNYTTCESICPIGNDIMAMLDNDPDLAAAPEVRVSQTVVDLVPGSGLRFEPCGLVQAGEPPRDLEALALAP